MPLTITEPAKYFKPKTSLDFRTQAARANALDAQADSYKLDNVAKKQAMVRQTKRAEIFKNVLSDPNLQGKDEESKLQAVGAAFMGAGMYEEWNATQKSLQDFKKAKVEQQKLQAEAQEKTAKALSPINLDLEKDSSDENILRTVKKLEYMGFPDHASGLAEQFETLKNVDPEKRSQYFGSLVPTEYRKLIQLDTGEDKKMVPTYGKETSYKVSVSPNTRESIASRESIATARLNQRERHHKERELNKETRLKIKTGLKSGSSAMRKQAIKEAGARMSAENSLNLINEMRIQVKNNPRYTATPLAPIARLGSAVWSMIDPTSNEKSPSITFMQTRDLLLATADQLVRDSRMSNQDRQRLENAIGGDGWASTPVNTIAALDRAEKIIRSSMEASEVDDEWETLPYAEKRKRILKNAN